MWKQIKARISPEVKASVKLFFKTIAAFFKRKEYKKYQDGYLHRTAKLIFAENIKIGFKTEIKDYVILQAAGKIHVGSYCQLNPFTVIYGGEVYIGNNVMIAPHCMIASGIHDYKQMEQPMRFAGWFSKGPIFINDDVWVGANCTITDGVTIGEGAVVAANSCVTKNVDPYSIVAGVPAKVIGNRKNDMLN